MKYTEKLHRRRRIYTGKSVNFSADVARLPDGKTSVREYLEHPGAVAVLPLMPGGRQAVFVRQYRYPVGKETLEIPAGKLSAKENPLACAKRELEEETGMRAGSIKKLFSYWPSAAFSTEVIHVYVATRLARGSFNPDSDEFIEPVIVDIDEAICMVRRGLIRDSKTALALLYYETFIRTRANRGQIVKPGKLGNYMEHRKILVVADLGRLTAKKAEQARQLQCLCARVRQKSQKKLLT
ncbi:MAG: ADP-ribose pyrophosphatase [Elusimicrobia bacterium HGW-Elusimicrobia-1]|jgi:ADP-ribose pyrophosphatase|nr:MAG: ADP-ribose pyrophosphatase [Elusimicrobia bacterium HGW-Elusimicrobia-1]